MFRASRNSVYGFLGSLLGGLLASGCATAPSGAPPAPVSVPSVYAPQKVMIPVSAFFDCLQKNGFQKDDLDAAHFKGRFITSLGKEKTDAHFWVRTLTFDVADPDPNHQKKFSDCNEKAILDTNKALSQVAKDDPVNGIQEGTIEGGGTLVPLELNGEWQFNGGRSTKFHAFYDTPPPRGQTDAAR